MYTQLGVLTKGTIIEVNVSELGMVTAGGKVVWGRWAQVVSFLLLHPASRSRKPQREGMLMSLVGEQTNNPEMDGCLNAVLLV